MPFSLAMIIAVSGIVFIVIAVMFALCEACQNSENSLFSLEELLNLKSTQRLRNNYCKRETETASFGL